MKLSEIITEGVVHTISPQEAKDRKMFGPVYHGTRGDINTILATGFSTKHSVPKGVYAGRPVGTSHGYSLEQYAWGIAAPVHHLGFGSYFTTVKAIAKQYNGDTVKGLKTFYIDSQNILDINFGSTNTMMKFWKQNGYSMTAEATQKQDYKAWIKATGELTRQLRSKADAIWFKGKGIRKLLDGDQVCVFNSKLIYVVDPGLATGLQIGSKVNHSGFHNTIGRNDLYVDYLQPSDFSNAGKLAGSGWKGIFRAVDHEGNDVPRSGNKNPSGQNIGNYPIHMIPPSDMVGTIVDARAKPDGEFMYDVKWKSGGTMYNYSEKELIPLKT